MIPLFRPIINDEALYKRILEQYDSGLLSEGKNTEYFERAMATKMGRTFAVACSSGTTALYMMLHMNLQMRRGHNKERQFCPRVPAYWFPAPYNALRSLGRYPNVYDEGIRVQAGDVVVHPNGTILDLPNNRYIHDCAHCAGFDLSTYDGDIALSFSAPKTLTTGQGGMILTNERNNYNYYRAFKNHDRPHMEACVHYGLNFKFDDTRALIGLSQLMRFDELWGHKGRIAQHYRERLGESFTRIPKPWLMAYRTDNPDALVAHLSAAGVTSSRLYRPINLMLFNRRPAAFANALDIYDHTVYLPSGPNLTDEDIDIVCNEVIKHGGLCDGR